MKLDEQLSGSVRVEGARVVVTMAGEIDLATMPYFRALLAEATELGVGLVEVDLAGVGFLDATALTVLVMAEQRLRAAGGRLRVLAVSPRVHLLFEITGLLDVLAVEQPAPASALLPALASLAGLPHTRDVLDAALKLVVTMAQAVVRGADGVSITLPRRGRLGTVAASNDVVLEMDHDQYDTGQGPCLDAATQGVPFSIHSLADEPRWPQFVPRAQARGIKSILSTPLLEGGRALGALNVYSRSADVFAAHEKRWAEQFAEQAATVVAMAERGPASATLDGEIELALASRELVAMAQGALMHRDGLSGADAFSRLRDLSRTSSRPLREVCAELLHVDLSAVSHTEHSGGSGHGRQGR